MVSRPLAYRVGGWPRVLWPAPCVRQLSAPTRPGIPPAIPVGQPRQGSPWADWPRSMADKTPDVACESKERPFGQHRSGGSRALRSERGSTKQTRILMSPLTGERGKPISPRI